MRQDTLNDHDDYYAGYYDYDYYAGYYDYDYDAGYYDYDYDAGYYDYDYYAGYDDYDYDAASTASTAADNACVECCGRFGGKRGRRRDVHGNG